jgi:predicted ATPase
MPTTSFANTCPTSRTTAAIDFDNLHGTPWIIAEEQNYNAAELNDFWQQGYLKANPKQKEILDHVMSAVESDEGTNRLFFIDGPGGTGKTFVENLILAKVRSTASSIALSVASSGIAAILLDGGRTAHS